MSSATAGPVDHAAPKIAAALIRFVQEGDFIGAIALLEGQADPNLGADGARALTAAACTPNVGLVTALLAAHASVNATAADGWTPLMKAAACSLPNIEPVARKLVEAAADVNAEATDTGSTALILASGNPQRCDVAELLLDAKANVNAATNGGKTALMNAAACSSLSTLQALLQAHADPNLRTAGSGGGHSALRLCVSGDDAARAFGSLTALMAAKADVHARASNRGETYGGLRQVSDRDEALQMASERGFVDAAELLLTQTEGELTADDSLLAAVQGHRVALTQVLLTRLKADPNARAPAWEDIGVSSVLGLAMEASNGSLVRRRCVLARVRASATEAAAPPLFSRMMLPLPLVMVIVDRAVVLGGTDAPHPTHFCVSPRK
jgi:hypothetical protein